MKMTKLLSNTDLGNKSFYLPFMDFINKLHFEIHARCSLTFIQRLQLHLRHVMYVSFIVPPLDRHAPKGINCANEPIYEYQVIIPGG